MSLHFEIFGCGFTWFIWQFSMSYPGLTIFHLGLRWKHKEFRLWELRTDEFRGLRYREIKDGKQRDCMMQSPLHFEERNV